MQDQAGDPEIRVVVADDHPVVRRGLRALLDTLPGIRVVGEAADGEAAVREAQLSRPDVVLMDLRMPGLDGVAATRRVRETTPGTAVLVLTMVDDDATVREAVRAGARGYLLKESEQEEILGALRAVAAGQLVLGGAVADRAGLLLTDDPVPAAPYAGLTAREQDVLELLAAGRSTTAIAAELFLSPKTVSNTLTRVFAKLGVTDRTAAVILAREAGLGRPRRPDRPGSPARPGGDPGP
ncbi:response regulator transcription factor [Nocardioides sp. CFH 31398]|uniref:response regulator transcription factor n=1 Tax=Nocardioides sp. CFH 31398 TaxID=2919579 RepID=UPI001F05549C|nr:response regulator transcription factor [Nocardioides sp. CFH 31398]MCH1864983.1 response regulator transcription factor [Nocardioides sp. CFH 31398]